MSVDEQLLWLEAALEGEIVVDHKSGVRSQDFFTTSSLRYNSQGQALVSGAPWVPHPDLKRVSQKCLFVDGLR